jgi:hypothetical protein
MANKRIIERGIGYAIITSEGCSTINEAVFAEDSGMEHSIELCIGAVSTMHGPPIDAGF